MLNDLAELYKRYGGLHGLVKSPYLWISFFLSLFVRAVNEFPDWASVILACFPSITGFAIASFAILLAITRGDQVALLIDDSSEDAPLLAVFSRILHVVVVQVFAIAFGSLMMLTGYIDRDSNFLLGAEDLAVRAGGVLVAVLVDFVGLSLLFYGLMLLISIVLSLFTFGRIIGRNH